jgi:hypothetical protein
MDDNKLTFKVFMVVLLTALLSGSTFAQRQSGREGSSASAQQNLQNIQARPQNQISSPAPVVRQTSPVVYAPRAPAAPIQNPAPQVMARPSEPIVNRSQTPRQENINNRVITRPGNESVVNNNISRQTSPVVSAPRAPATPVQNPAPQVMARPSDPIVNRNPAPRQESINSRTTIRQGQGSNDSVDNNINKRSISADSTVRNSQRNAAGVSRKETVSPDSALRQTNPAVSTRESAEQDRVQQRINRPAENQRSPQASAPVTAGGRINRKEAVSPSRPDNPVPTKPEVRQPGISYNSTYPNSSRSISYYRNRDYCPTDSIFSWITLPSARRPIYYSWGSNYCVNYFRPYYHRKFVFVSLNGYWPDYNYMRYYWYGWQPYSWYGYYPPSYVVPGSTYNYYYYDVAPPQSVLNQTQDRLYEQPAAEPTPADNADLLFEKATAAFEKGDYADSATLLVRAMKLAPDDIVMPYAYVQALFANGQYKKASQELRDILSQASMDKEGVFYPRGLYKDEQTLELQIEQLERLVSVGSSDADLELLLGYQLLGTGRYDQAESHLNTAIINNDNSQAAKVLIDLLETLRQANLEQTTTDSDGQYQTASVG